MLRVMSFLGLLLLGLPALAQSYPSRPVRLVIPFPAGGGTDVVGRHFANALSTVLGQPVVVDNRPGASAIVGSLAVANAPADGYTALYATSSVLAINAATRPRLPYDPVASFAPVSLVGLTPMIVLVQANAPFTSLAEMIAAARREPGSLRYAAVSDTIALAVEMVNGQARTRIEAVPYRGAGEAYGDFLAGRIQVMFDPIPTGYALVRNGSARGLGVTTGRRAAMAPEVPTIAEAADLPGFDVSIWYSLMLPAGTPAPIIERLNQAAVKALSAPELRSKFAEIGVEPRPSTPKELADFVRSETARWRTVAREANIATAE
jgi:tripartite-type tricarboxylate transporter receptor subunit TctC